jgi:tRNA-splicing ligase RtcB (3'-phosphate/5'-hydroxy nucleic acid ligase)
MYAISDRIVAFIPPETIEPEALAQIRNTASLPVLFKHVAVMPDTHYGRGSTVGTVLPTQGAVIPAAVGVDIGCGMIAVKTTLRAERLEGQLHDLRLGIERRIPMSAGRFNRKITPSAGLRIQELESLPGARTAHTLSPNWHEQLGTLGGGNHFIEVCVDTEAVVWVTLHSGSRGVGNRIGNHYIRKAKANMTAAGIRLPDLDLAYLVEGTREFDDYIRDLLWAQRFALLNREEMLDRVMMEIAAAVGLDHAEFRTLEHERVNCHHNFTQIERHFGADTWVTRKGAIRASVGLKGMIPGSMGTRSYIVSGRGNAMSFESAPHGAGRRMSRSKAKASFTMADLDKAMAGIEHRRSAVLIDEIPLAYKDIDEVMENARELVTIDATLKQILNVKGD